MTFQSSCRLLLYPHFWKTENQVRYTAITSIHLAIHLSICPFVHLVSFHFAGLTNSLYVFQTMLTCNVKLTTKVLVELLCSYYEHGLSMFCQCQQMIRTPDMTLESMSI